jgi:anaerobic selenocysteine-containing dehydrogenase
MGITQHVNGVDNVQAIVNLALARGWVGRPGCGLLPIRGHSNVQGVGSVGVTPAVKAEFASRLAELYGVAPPTGPGLHTIASVEAAAEGRIDAAVLLGGNLVYVSTKLNESHVHGRGRTHLVLPALVRDEEHECTTQESMFNYVRLSEGGAAASSSEMRSEVDVLTAIAAAALPAGPLDWGSLASHAAIRAAIAAVVPGYRAIGDIDRTRGEFHVAGRVFHEPRFATSDGRARMRPTPLPAFAPAAGEVRVMTLRSEGQFNTVVYEDEDVYRGNDRRDVVMMSGEDAARLGLSVDARVRVENAVGAMVARVRIAPLPPGNVALYYPEANVLVPRDADPRSATPAFKSLTARIVPLEPLAHPPSSVAPEDATR